MAGHGRFVSLSFVWICLINFGVFKSVLILTTKVLYRFVSLSYTWQDMAEILLMETNVTYYVSGTSCYLHMLLKASSIAYREVCDMRLLSLVP